MSKRDAFATKSCLDVYRENIERLSEALLRELSEAGSGRELSLAQVRVEEARFWALEHFNRIAVHDRNI